MASVRGDLRPGDVVWLVPRTMTAPAICWRNTSAVVVRFDPPHIHVTVDGQPYRVHEDNVQRGNPQYHKPARDTAKPARRLTLPDGAEEQPLF